MKSPPAPPFSAPTDTCDTPTCARDRIFQAARDLFYRHGLRGVSVDTIAAEAGTTKVTLYRVFSSKDDLIVQCLEDHTRRFWQAWDEVVAPYEGQPRRQIEALFALIKDCICAKEAERGCPIANAAIEIADDEHPAMRVIREYTDELTQRMRALARELGARHPDELGDALTLLMEGAFATRVVFSCSDHAESVGLAARALLDSAELGAAVERK